MSGQDLYFEDFTVGRIFQADGVTLTAGLISEFALSYDPQPFHIDVEAAKKSIYGGQIASGFQTLAISFRMFMQTGATAACSLGGRGIDKLRWPAPVRPGDTLRTTVTVLEQRPSSSKPDRGTCRLGYETVNQHGEIVLTCEAMHIMARRRPAVDEPVAV